MCRSPLSYTLAMGFCALPMLWGCERAAEPRKANAKPVAAATTQPSGQQLADVRALVDASAPTPAAQTASGLPPGHPPVDVMPTAPPPGMTAAPAAEQPLRYDAPDGWERQPVQSAMRVDQFDLPAVTGDERDGSVIIYYFGPGGGGGIEANIARWTNQFSLADGSPIPDEQIVRQTLEANGLKITLLDVAGRFQAGAMHMGGPLPPSEDNFRLLAAIVEGPGGPWFIKATGPSATMAEHRDAFVAFLESMNVE